MDFSSVHLPQFSSKKHAVLLISFIILITILIAFLGIVYARSTTAAPKDVLISNIDTTHATLSFITPVSRKHCVVWYAIWPPQSGSICEKEKTKVHYTVLSPLISHTSYHVLVLSTFKIQALPVVTTLSKEIEINQNNTKDLIGKVIDEAGVPQFDAVVSISIGKSDTTWTTVTNERGLFSLTVPDVTLLDHAGVSSWSEAGYVAEEMSVVDFLSNVPIFEVIPYE